MAEQYNLIAARDVGSEADDHTSNAVLNNGLFESSFDSDFGGL
jgi:hypothetical protein